MKKAKGKKSVPTGTSRKAVPSSPQSLNRYEQPLPPVRGETYDNQNENAEEAVPQNTLMKDFVKGKQVFNGLTTLWRRILP
jgi:hypothetical protein